MAAVGESTLLLRGLPYFAESRSLFAYVEEYGAKFAIVVDGADGRKVGYVTFFDLAAVQAALTKLHEALFAEEIRHDDTRVYYYLDCEILKPTDLAQFVPKPKQVRKERPRKKPVEAEKADEEEDEESVKDETETPPKEAPLPAPAAEPPAAERLM